MGLKLLSRVKPSEILFKSISKDVTRVDITYPARFDFRVSLMLFKAVLILETTAPLLHQKTNEKLYFTKDDHRNVTFTNHHRS